MNPIGLERIAWKFYLVYVVILVIECVTIYFVFPETKGYTLEEVGHFLDEEGAVKAALSKVDAMKPLNDDVERIELSAKL